MNKTVNQSAALATSALLLAGLTACSSTPSISKSKLSSDVQKTLNAKGVKASDVKCKDDLQAKVGATSKCDAKVDGTTQHMQAKVTSVDGKTINYSVSKD